MTEFEYHGYFETLVDPVTGKVLGTRLLEVLGDRIVGEAGRAEFVYVKDFEVTRGHKTTTVRVGKGRTLISIINRLCGRIKR